MEPTRETLQAETKVALPFFSGPSILGFFGFAAATFLLGAHMAGWYGSGSTSHYLFPFVMMVGGLLQVLASMWAFRARDPVAIVMHGIWGAAYLAYGVFNYFTLTGALQVGTPEAQLDLGYGFAVLAAITWACVGGALSRNVATVSTLTVLACAATLQCISLFLGSHLLGLIAGYVFVASACLAFLTATAELLAESFGRELVPYVGFRRGRREEVTYR